MKSMIFLDSCLDSFDFGFEEIEAVKLGLVKHTKTNECDVRYLAHAQMLLMVLLKNGANVPINYQADPVQAFLGRSRIGVKRDGPAFNIREIVLFLAQYPVEDEEALLNLQDVNISFLFTHSDERFCTDERIRALKKGDALLVNVFDCEYDRYIVAANDVENKTITVFLGDPEDDEDVWCLGYDQLRFSKIVGGDNE